MATPGLSELTALSDKAALVTGAGMGIGRAIAQRLAEAGARVLVCDINADAAAETVSLIENEGGEALALQTDASRPADATRAVERAVEAFGDLHLLVNNAGIFPAAPALDMTEEQWDRVLDLNLKGLFFHCQAAARHMVKAGHGGRIVNIASVDAFLPAGNIPHYDASKGGVVMLTRSLAKDLAGHDILVNAVAPGAINTPGARAAVSKIMAHLKLKEGEMMPPRSPLGRNGEPDDIARAVFFLCSGLSDYVTGATVIVDGGYLLM